MSTTNGSQIMVPDLQSALLCDDVRQERNGKFILIGIFDGLMVQSLPTAFPRVCLVTRWCCGQGAFLQRSRIVWQDGHTLLAEGQPIPVRLPDSEQVATSVEVFLNLRIPQAGPYWVEVLLDQRLRLRFPLHVRLAPQRPQAGDSPHPATPPEG